MPTVPLPKIFADMARPPNHKGAIPLPLSSSDFSFDSVGVAGFFGGDSSVAGMATVNLIPFRRWAGWYNNPGSYEIAKKYGPLGKARWLDGPFPDGEHNPAKLFKLDGGEGPPFVAAHSGTTLPSTGHLSHLIMKKVADMKLSYPQFKPAGEHSRVTTSPGATIVDLRWVRDLQKRTQPPLEDSLTAVWALVPIAVSIGACLVCALVGDWFCFASIAMGIMAHGLACYVIGSGRLALEHPKPAPNAPQGDGVLKGNKEWVILVGAEEKVNVFTRGRFLLHYGTVAENESNSDLAVQEGVSARWSSDSGKYHDKEESSGSLANDREPLLSQTNQGASTPPSSPPPPSHASSTQSTPSMVPPQWLIGACAILLMVQFIGQLLVIPHGTLFGQLMFIATVLASWIYNTFLSSIDRDEVQVQILYNAMKINEKSHFKKYQLNTFTATVAFACFALASENPHKEPIVFLDAILPNRTEVWKVWKEKMAERMKAAFPMKAPREFKFSPEDLKAVAEGPDRELLKTLFDDAEYAWDAWSKVRDSAFAAPDKGDGRS